MPNTPNDAGLAVLVLLLLVAAAWRLSPTIRVTTRDTIGKLLFLAALAAIAVAILTRHTS